MDKELAKRIGLAVRAARTSMGCSQADAAELIGISAEFYARIERGGTLPSVPTLFNMASAMNVSADSLLGLRSGTPRRVFPRAISESPDVRRLLRRLRRAKPRSLRLLNLIVTALEER